MWFYITKAQKFLEIQSTQNEDGNEQETFLFNGYEVGQAVVDTKAYEADKKAEEAQKEEESKEEQSQNNEAQSGSFSTFEIAVVVLVGLIGLGLILIVISVIKKKKKK